MNPLSRQLNTPADGAADQLWLLTPEEIEELTPGTILTSIMGRKAVTGSRDEIDLDTRGGWTAWGFLESQMVTIDTVNDDLESAT